MRPQALQADERRKTCRYGVQVPVLFRWSDTVMHTEGGFTRDVSLKALFVTSTAAPPVKTHLELQMLLPASGNIAGNAVKATGRVVRLSSQGEGRGFVVSARLYTDTQPAKMRIQ